MNRKTNYGKTPFSPRIKIFVIIGCMTILLSFTIEPYHKIGKNLLSDITSMEASSWNVKTKDSNIVTIEDDHILFFSKTKVTATISSRSLNVLKNS